ncbi:MAG: hypothetical protein AAF639_06050 [Chloroflexota bacterium]
MTSVYAHQPYFEDNEFTFSAPYFVPDATISTAVYADLDTGVADGISDVDYFAFQGVAGQRVLLAMSIPQIEGQDYFAPEIVLMGPGLPATILPASIQMPAGDNIGAVVIADPNREAPIFFEPFSRTRYWDRQERYVPLTEDGDYLVAVWHPNGQRGRYTFVIGEREIRGGDPNFVSKMRTFWQPLPPAQQPTPIPTATSVPASSVPASSVQEQSPYPVWRYTYPRYSY